jgi:hypothetical protein
MMVRLIPIFLILFPLTTESQVWKVMAVSNESPAIYVNISGETNINCFECRYRNIQENSIYQDVKLTYEEVPGETIKMDIPVSQFKCSNEIIFNDFIELLKAGEYPDIRIEIDPSGIKNIMPGKSAVDLHVSITIASITMSYPISCWINHPGNNSISISGTTTINMVDFQLKPPVKFLGMVRVRNKVTIDFSFNFIVD